jgi:hypothetical protein
MAEYHFVSTWQIQAPIERVWEEIYHAERWPSWWKYVVGVDELEPGAADGAGKRQRLLFRTARRLGADLALPDTPSRPHWPVGAAWWVVLGGALVAVVVLGWRRSTSPR